MNPSGMRPAGLALQAAPIFGKDNAPPGHFSFWAYVFCLVSFLRTVRTPTGKYVAFSNNRSRFLGFMGNRFPSSRETCKTSVNFNLLYPGQTAS
jgi:hypothetical protein